MLLKPFVPIVAYCLVVWAYYVLLMLIRHYDSDSDGHDSYANQLDGVHPLSVDEIGGNTDADAVNCQN